MCVCLFASKVKGEKSIIWERVKGQKDIIWKGTKGQNSMVMDVRFSDSAHHVWASENLRQSDSSKPEFPVMRFEYARISANQMLLPSSSRAIRFWEAENLTNQIFLGYASHPISLFSARSFADHIFRYRSFMQPTKYFRILSRK